MDLLKIKPIQIDMTSIFSENNDLQLFNEAVFTGAKSKMEKIDKAWEEVKKALDEELAKHDNLQNQTKFDSEKFYKHPVWKKIEDACVQVFGFRYLEVQPMPNEYLGKGKFAQMWVNAYTSPEKRFPIDGLVTKDGFYDSIHSLTGVLIIELPALQILTAKELTGILLHEIGHNIDPALADIRYSQINEYSKYITDTKSDKIDSDPSKAPGKIAYYIFLNFCAIIVPALIIATGPIGAITTLVIMALYNLVVKPLWARRVNPFMMNADVAAKKLSKEVIKDIKKNDMFNKKNNIEAFADNFARMYGYGAIEAKALKKIEDINLEKGISKLYGKWAVRSSRALAEGLRAQLFTRIMISSITDEHKTNVHRLHSMIKEYENELKDDLIPTEVKKQIRYDFDQVLKVAKMYFTSPDNVKNKLCINIFKALQETNKTETTVEDILNVADDDIKKESVDYDPESFILLEKVNKLKRIKNKKDRKNFREALRSKISASAPDIGGDDELNFKSRDDFSDTSSYMKADAYQNSDSRINDSSSSPSSTDMSSNTDSSSDSNGLAPLFKLENHLTTYKSLKSRFENADPSQKNNLLNKFVNGIQGSLQFSDMEKLYNELNQTRISVVKTADDPLIPLFHEDRRTNKFKMTEGFINDTIKIHAPAKYFNLIEAARIFVEAYYAAQKVGSSPINKFMKVRDLIRDNNEVDRVMSIKAFDQMLSSIKTIKNNITNWGSSNNLKGGARKGALKDSEIKPILREMAGLVKEAYDNNKPFMRAIPMLIMKSLDLRSKLMKRVLDSIR